MPHSDLPDEVARYHAKVEEFLGAIDSVLAEGTAVQRCYDAFAREHGITDGSGERALTAETLSPQARFIHSRLLDLQRQVYDQHLGSPRPISSVATTAPRALGNRTRI